MKEEWRDIEGYEGMYQVSNLGRVRSLDRHVKNWVGKKLMKGKMISVCNDGRGYLLVNLWKNNKPKNIRTHRLIAKAFIPNPENKPQINHINGDGTDNRIENLEWCTASENIQHAHNTGLASNVNKRKKISMKSLDGKTLFIFDSILEASIITGYPNTGICDCCRGGRATSKGYKWEYRL